MKFVLVTVSGGIIDEVRFYEDAMTAVQALFEYVKVMDVERSDAAVYGLEGMIANAKIFMGENAEI
ncbi:hypothetical protein ACFLZM_00785 [Thermodesulfobacteriota bacterium]